MFDVSNRHVLDWCSIETLPLANFLTDQAGGEVSQGNTAQPNSNIEMQAVQAALCLNRIGYIKVVGASIGGVIAMVWPPWSPWLPVGTNMPLALPGTQMWRTSYCR